eukprot:IDg15117t1
MNSSVVAIEEAATAFIGYVDLLTYAIIFQ